MKPRLLEHFHSLCDHAARSKAKRRDTDPVVDAFGYLIWLTALGKAQPVPRASVAALRRLGQLTLLALQASDDTPTADLEDRAHAAGSVGELIRVGIRILEGSSAPLTDVTTTTLHPPSATLARMLEGKADGLTAGRYGMHVLSCRRCQTLLKALPTTIRTRAADAPVMLAASASAHVRAPEGGRVVAQMKVPKAEAVLFNDPDARRLAVYTTSTQPLRIVADGVTTEDARAGYWIGRIDNDVREINATLHYAATTGLRSAKLRVPLDDTAKRVTKNRAKPSKKTSH